MNLWTLIIIDIVIVMTVHILIFTKGLPRIMRIAPLSMYLVGTAIIIYLGFPRFQYVSYASIHLPSLAVFLYVLLTTIFTIVLSILCYNKKQKEMFIILFPLTTLPLVVHYSYQTNLIYIDLFVHSIGATAIMGIVITFTTFFFYLKAKTASDRKTRENYAIGFYLLFGYCIMGLFGNSATGIYSLIPYVWFISIVILFCIMLTKKSNYADYIIGK